MIRTKSWSGAGAGEGFRSMSTKTQSSNVSIPRLPQELVNFIDALSRSALGRSASIEELRGLAESIQKTGDRRWAVQSVLTTEEALVRLAEPWFWKLLSRSADATEMAEFVGSVRSGTPFDAA